MRVTIPDDLADTLNELTGKSAKTIDAVAERVLTRFAAIPLDERIVILRAADREALEQITSHPIRDASDLLALIDRLAGLSFGNVKLTLTVKHQEELARRAEKRGVSIDALIAEIAAELEPLFFDRASGFGVSYTPATEAAQAAASASGASRPSSMPTPRPLPTP